MEKHNINKAKLILQRDVDISDFATYGGHSCDKCLYILTEEQWEVFNDLRKLEDTLSYEVKSTLVYIAGYVTRKDESNPCDTFSYFECYGTFTNSLDRGGLNIPGDSVCEWVFLSYI